MRKCRTQAVKDDLGSLHDQLKIKVNSNSSNNNRNRMEHTDSTTTTATTNSVTSTVSATPKHKISRRKRDTVSSMQV